MANRSKRFHSKSRNGCGQCKRRRVRCNFQGPVCSNCHRRNEFCDYLVDYDSHLPEIEGSRSHAYTTTPFEPIIACRPMKSFSFEDEYAYLSSCAELFIALDYYPILANEGDLQACTKAFFSNTDWPPFALSRDKLPVSKGDYGYQNKTLDYLLPTISSLCAMHQTLQRESQSPGTYAQALQYNITASTRFRHTENGVHEGNWLPMLMFGVGYIMFSFADALSAPDCDFDYLSVFHILRGTAKIGDEIGEHLEKSYLSGILQRRRRELAEPSGPDDSLQAINQLGLSEHPTGTSETTRAHCRHALDKLKWWARFVHGTPQIWKHFILWPASVTDGFIIALKEKQPLALLTYIYWCTVMYRAPRRWYTDGWHQRVAVAVMSELGPEYDALLEWPSFTLSLPTISSDVRGSFHIS
ncbi:hypothetical protein GGS24DRAFT_446357 [Hypoxylon argillaceum]|nr:hypothetical protein GGS24DRAFT_446357 [Hypoxylon argillaceum]